MIEFIIYGKKLEKIKLLKCAREVEKNSKVSNMFIYLLIFYAK